MTTAERAGDAPFPPKSLAWRMAGTLAVAWFIAYMDRQVFSVLAESLRRDLGLSDTQLGLVQGLAFALFFATAGLPLGRLADRANRRNLLIFGVLAWSLMTVCCGLAHNFWQLFAARVGVGVGEACLAPATLSIIADYFRPERRGMPMSAMLIGNNLGAASSTLLGGLILQTFGPRPRPVLPVIGAVQPWQMVFLLLGGLGVLVALLLLTVREPRRRERAAATGPRPSFLAYMKPHARAFSTLYLAYGLNSFVGNAVSAWGIVLLIRVHHLPPAQAALIIAGIVITAGSLAGILGGALSDGMARRYPADGRMRLMFLTVPIMGLLCALLFVPDNLWAALAAFASVPLFSSMTIGSSYSAIQDLVPNELRGQAMSLTALLNIALGLGSAPTAVALVTDYVFHDPMKLSYSIAAVVAPASVAGTVLVALGLGAYARAVAARRAMVAA
jgi:MFS family permease